MHMNERDMLELSSAEALVLRLLIDRWEVLAEQAQELRLDLLAYEGRATERDLDLMRAMLAAREREMSEVVDVGHVVSGGIDDVVVSGEVDWEIVD